MSSISPAGQEVQIVDYLYNKHGASNVLFALARVVGVDHRIEYGLLHGISDIDRYIAKELSLDDLGFSTRAIEFKEQLMEQLGREPEDMAGAGDIPLSQMGLKITADALPFWAMNRLRKRHHLYQNTLRRTALMISMCKNPHRVLLLFMKAFPGAMEHFTTNVQGQTSPFEMFGSKQNLPAGGK
jgi:hypothetical protein